LDYQELHLVSPVPLTVNHYTGIRVINKRGKNIPVTFVTPEAKKYKREFIKYIREQVKIQNWKRVDNKYHHLYMDGIFYFARTNIDAANCDKILSDAITESEVVWDDDSGILFRPQRIYYDTQNPRIELTIHPVEYCGVFPTEEDSKKFEDHCKTCRRYNNNCSILRKAMECRIQDEIKLENNNYICSKFKEKKEN